jgi:hypothetical protein
MRELTQLAVIGALLCSSGCIVVSISPLCPDKDAVFEPALVGTWIESPSARYTFSKLGENAYRIDVVDGKERQTMTGRLFRLDGTLFLDVSPTDELDELGVPEQAVRTLRGWYLPLHLYVRVNQVTPTLSTSAIDESWLKDYLGAHPTALAHLMRGGNVILTGSTADIQEFLRANVNTPGAFEKGTELTRQKQVS